MIGKADQIVQWLFSQDRDKTWEIKEYREKRSLNANALAWKLIGEMADILRASKDDIYVSMLKRYGQSQLVSVKSDINVAGFFKYYEEAGRSSLNGTPFTHYRVFKGSSEYDTREMSVLIDGIISECAELGIDTMPPEDVERVKESWK